MFEVFCKKFITIFSCLWVNSNCCSFRLYDIFRTIFVENVEIRNWEFHASKGSTFYSIDCFSFFTFTRVGSRMFFSSLFEKTKIQLVSFIFVRYSGVPFEFFEIIC